jgi:uncharacterized protein (DUF2336 family)
MSLPLLTELDAALTSATAHRRTSILDQVVDLFLPHAELYSAEQVAVFDEVFLLLVKSASNGALTAVSRKMAAVENAPTNTITALARHVDIAVAAPILEKSPALAEAVMVEMAGVSPKHLHALSNRANIGEPLADILIESGDAGVLRKLATNAGARISEIGFVKLINHAKADGALASAIGARADLPSELAPFLELAINGA